ncbi:FXSXX-COOH protein [Micromonospora citrea]|uniref:FXSXX-COOH protein n=1 Tax=Micromonospora citrea TaxID=47855 RepID=UPI001FDF2FDB|nr:FXSXX-COOH protein [Micromonospora citrea]
MTVVVGGRPSTPDRDGGTDVDRTVRQPDLSPPPLDDLRRTPLGRIPVDRARSVAHVTSRREARPARVDVAAFTSAI